jgi:hypothetical protein
MSYRVFICEEEIWICSYEVVLPSYFYLEILKWLIVILYVESSVLFLLLIPALSLFTNSLEFLLFFFFQRVVLKVWTVRHKQLFQCFNSVILQNVTQIIYVIYLTYLFDFVNIFCISERYIMRPNCKWIALLHLYSFLGDVHPCTALSLEILNIESFKAVKFKLSMFSIESCALYL